MSERIVILDFGSQYTQLIARRVREAGVFSEIHPCTLSADEVAALQPSGLILSGGPLSVYDAEAPSLQPQLLELERGDGTPVPVLGICYGLQAMAHLLGGGVEAAERREFGRADLTRVAASGEGASGNGTIDDDSGGGALFDGVPEGSTVWMSHGDHLTTLPDGYEVIARTTNAPVAAVRSRRQPHYGVQFHPEVVHTDYGREVLENFALRICGCEGDWSPASFVEEQVAAIREQVGEKAHVMLGLSGGVDSSVAAALISKAVGERLHCVFVDNGVLRKNEFAEVQEAFR
ncbi:MAG: GMP synthase (glutamine-hydrolyzing), partial [Bacteroidetes bacterium QS_8_68_15]